MRALWSSRLEGNGGAREADVSLAASDLYLQGEMDRDAARALGTLHNGPAHAEAVIVDRTAPPGPPAEQPTHFASRAPGY